MIADTLIAGCAFALSLYAMYATHRHNRLSVTPHIVGSRGKDRRDDGIALTYDICNHGIGPAKILSFTFFIDGRSFTPPSDEEPVEALVRTRVGGRVRYVLRKHSFPGIGYSIIAGQAYRVADLFIPGAKISDEALLDTILSGLDLRIEYESFYGVKYAFDTRKKA